MRTYISKERGFNNFVSSYMKSYENIGLNNCIVKLSISLNTKYKYKI